MRGRSGELPSSASCFCKPHRGSFAMVSSDLLSKRPTERGPKMVFRTMAQMETRKASSDNRNEVSFRPSWMMSKPISPLATMAIPNSAAGAQSLESRRLPPSEDLWATRSQNGTERPTTACSDRKRQSSWLQDEEEAVHCFLPFQWPLAVITRCHAIQQCLSTIS